MAAGGCEDHRVEKIRAALEHAHTPPLPGVIARQGRSDGGLALPRGDAGHEQGRAMNGWRGHVDGRRVCLGGRRGGLDG